MTAESRPPPGPVASTPLRVGLAGATALVVVAVVGLAWAKWLPCADKASVLARTRSWGGGPIFGAADPSGVSPTLAGAWRFTMAYFDAVWRALVVALLLAAAVDALLPRRWLLAGVGRRSRLGQAAAGGILATPSMMCTCCAAPVTAGLRRSGAPLAASIAYWMGNPLLNPAVLVFLSFVLPWQYVAVRLVVGGGLVLAAGVLVSRWVERRGESRVPQAPVALDDPRSPSELPRRYLVSLSRLTLVLVPEYAVVVLALGFMSGQLSDFTGLQQQEGLAGLLLVAFTATALVIPTGGEIPVIAAMTAVGAGAVLSGVLLIALPAVSAPSMVMVGRALGWRATVATGALVVMGSLMAGALLAALT